MSKVKLGFKAKLYFNSSAYSTPTWSEISAISDCSVSSERDDIESSARAAVVKTSELGMMSLSIGGKIRSDDTDTNGFVLLETAFLTASIIDVLVLDGDITVNGNRGYRFDAKNHKFSEDQGLGNALYREFELKPCVSVNAPSKAVVATGAPVFTVL